MPRRSNSLRFALVAALALLAIGAGAWALVGGSREKPELGLLTTLPIYWSESFDIGEALSGSPHWARIALEEDYRLTPLDTLEAEGRGLATVERLLLAQPRALAPAENVALDDWVRGGGRALIFADPMLTGGSRFHLGDRRRPQDVVLLSPILRHWGLDLRFDPDQPEGERAMDVGGASLPVNLAGTLAPIATEAPARCAIEASGLVADCRIGGGYALVIADAALLDRDRADGVRALEALAARAFER